MKAIIIGAGIGGLSTALALQKQGIDVAVYEQAAQPREAGAGLSLWANAVKALRQIGIDPVELGVEFHAAIRTPDGTMLSQIAPEKLVNRFGTATIAVHRVDLMHALLQKVGDVVNYDHRLERYTQDDTSITAHFTNGTTAEGDLLIGADGIHSIVRGQMQPDAKPIYHGYPAWRGIATFSHTHNIWGETWGRGARFGIVPLDAGRIYWFATANRPANTPPADHLTALRDLFGDWHAPIPELIATTPPEAILYNDVTDIEPLSTWIDGRAILLGDAAHAMTPNMGQGACQAIEDAVSLATHLKQNIPVDAALTAYEAHRLPHTRRVVLRSRAIGKLGQVENPIFITLRNTFTRLTPSSVTLRGLDFVLAP